MKYIPIELLGDVGSYTMTHNTIINALKPIEFTRNSQSLWKT
jgi:hypothetical protein